MTHSVTLEKGSLSLLEGIFSKGGFFLFIAAVGLIIYSDDIQLTSYGIESPSIYSIKFAGLDILDYIAVLLVTVTAIAVLLRSRITISSFHPYLFGIFCVYAYAAIVGFIYSFIYDYKLLQLLQDFQQIIYMLGFFFVTFYLLDTKRKWQLFVWALLFFFCAKNFIIVSRVFSGEVKAFGDFTFRSSQSSDNMIFPIMFFPILFFIVKKQASFVVKTVLFISALLFFAHTLLGVGRTLYVIYPVGFILVFFELNRREKIRYLSGLVVFFAVLIIILSALFPRFLEYAFGYRALSIFDWAISGDRSNATRTLEFLNMTHRLLDQGTFLQGMGLGSWWDDRFYRLLPDWGSGFTFKTRYYYGHLFFVTQLLKLGLVATVIYWFCIFKMLRMARRAGAALEWTDRNKPFVLGIYVGLVGAFLMSSDFVRLFLFCGIGLGVIASYHTYFQIPLVNFKRENVLTSV